MALQGQTKLAKWERIVAKKGLDLRRPINFVTATDIKKLVAEEPRLMAKIDTRESLPEIFKKHNIFILPVSNRKYALVKGEGYHNLEKAPNPKSVRSRLPFMFATSGIGLSEMEYIDYAYNSGMVEHFLGVGNLFLTIRGKKFSPDFAFRVDGSPVIEVSSVQVEIDAGFEGRNDIVLVEGKMGHPNNFIIRQLYYPFRFWDTRVPNKQIIPVFFCFKDQCYYFWQYRFRDKRDYESIELVRKASYKIVVSAESALSALELSKIEPDKEKKWIIPQADDLTKIVEFPFRVLEGMDNSSQIASYFQFTGRQSSYYREATEALGLVRLRNNRYQLTDIGKAYVGLPVQERNELFCRLIFELPIMNRVLVELLIKPRKSLSREEVAQIVAALSHLTGTTPLRRAQTILAWFRWIQRSVGILRVEENTISLLRS